MIGLIFAALIYGVNALVFNLDTYVSLSHSLAFLWYYYLIILIGRNLIVALVPLAGATLAVLQKKDRAVGLTAVLISPLLFVFVSLTPLLFFVGTILISKGIGQDGIHNIDDVTAGLVAYGLGLIVQIYSKTAKPNEE